MQTQLHQFTSPSFETIPPQSPHSPHSRLPQGQLALLRCRRARRHRHECHGAPSDLVGMVTFLKAVYCTCCHPIASHFFQQKIAKVDKSGWYQYVSIIPNWCEVLLGFAAIRCFNNILTLTYHEKSSIWD